MANYVLCIKDYLFGEDVLCSVGEIYPLVISIKDEIEVYQVYFNKINCIFYYEDSQRLAMDSLYEHFMLLSEFRQNRLEEILNG